MWQPSRAVALRACALSTKGRAGGPAAGKRRRGCRHTPAAPSRPAGTPGPAHGTETPHRTETGPPSVQPGHVWGAAGRGGGARLVAVRRRAGATGGRGRSGRGRGAPAAAPQLQERVRGRRRHAQPVLLPVGQAPAQPRALLMTPSDVRKASHAQLRHAARPAVRHGGSLALRTQMLPPPHGHTHALPSRPPPRTPSAPAAVLAGQPARQQAGEGAVRGRHAARLVPGRRARAA